MPTSSASCGPPAPLTLSFGMTVDPASSRASPTRSAFGWPAARWPIPAFPIRFPMSPAASRWTEAWTIRDVTRHQRHRARAVQRRAAPRCEGGGVLTLHLTGTRMVLEQELRDALPPGMRRIWDDVDPRGTAEFTARVRHHVGSGRPRWNWRPPRSAIRSRSSRPGFPIGWNGFGVSSPGRMVCCGSRGCGVCMPGPPSPPRAPAGLRPMGAGMSPLQARRRPVSGRSRPAPRAAGRPAAGGCRRAAQGAAVARRGARHLLDRPREVSCRVGEPRRYRAPLRRPGTCNSTWSRPRWTWGSPRSRPWRHPAAGLERWPDLAILRRGGARQRDLAGAAALGHPRSAGDRRGWCPVRCPAAAVMEPGTSRRLTARVAGGTLQVDGSMAAGEAGRFTVALALADAELERLSADLSGGPTTSRGRVQGAVEMSGSRAGSHSLSRPGPVAAAGCRPLRTARGRRALEDPAGQGARPHRLREQHGGLPDRGAAGLSRHDRTLRRCHQPRRGGRGRSRFPRATHVSAHHGRGRNPAARLEAGAGGAGGQFLVVHVDGTLAEPVTSTEAFPTLAAAVQ